MGQHLPVDLAKGVCQSQTVAQAFILPGKIFHVPRQTEILIAVVPQVRFLDPGKSRSKARKKYSLLPLRRVIPKKHTA